MSSAPPTEPDTHTGLEDESEIARAIDALLDEQLPADWADPAAIERRRDQLRTAAGEAAQATLELLTAARLATARGDTLRPDDAAVDAFAAAMAALHRGMRVYRRDTRLQDALELVRAAMVAEAGGGIAELVVRLLERLWDEMLPEQLRQL